MDNDGQVFPFVGLLEEAPLLQVAEDLRVQDTVPKDLQFREKGISERLGPPVVLEPVLKCGEEGLQGLVVHHKGVEVANVQLEAASNKQTNASVQVLTKGGWM